MAGSILNLSNKIHDFDFFFFKAGELLKSIDDRLDPCDDFFQFACGRWMEHNHIPQGKIQWTQFDILDRKMNLAIKGKQFPFEFNRF